MYSIGKARSYRLREGRLPVRGPEVVLDATMAAHRDITLGESVWLQTPSGLKKLEVVGLLEPYGPALFNGGMVLFLPLAEAQKIFALPGEINSLQLVVASGADLTRVRETVQNSLPDGLFVQVPASRGTISQGVLTGVQQGLSSLTADPPRHRP